MGILKVILKQGKKIFLDTKKIIVKEEKAR